MGAAEAAACLSLRLSLRHAATVAVVRMPPLLLLLSVAFTASFVLSSCVDRPCDLCAHRFSEGDVCGTELLLPLLFCDQSTRLIKESPNEFLRCEAGHLRRQRCASATIFVAGQGCVDPTMHLHMHGLQVSGSGRVGDLCQYNTDCLSGMYCSGGVCTCLSTYILRESYCYEKINPNQPGCTYDVQCEAVWPGAKCSMDSSVGTCRCPEETHVARETRDGWVCVSLKDIGGGGGSAPLYFACPLPEGAGFKIALNDPNPVLGSFPVGCTVGSTASVEPVADLHGGGACMWPSTGEFLGDIYDCIHTSPHVNLASKFPQSSYASSADGVCCPSRALACIQPQATGPNPTEPRWWYNAVTGTCQQFMWDPSASEAKYHSANNFKTIQHCESYCRDTCQRGSPQYTSEASVLAERPLTTCATSMGCNNDYQCTSVGSQHLCCPTPAVVCSMRGGRPLDINPRNHVYHPGFMVSTGRESIRFFYDPASGRCKDFVYKGAGGNYNNFLSKNECEMYCERLQCERGSPLRVGENAQRCQTNAQCPSSHECKADHGVCCPRKQTICAQPLRVGDCTENVKRYWYNAKTRQCQMFEYTGCQGNDNNFESIIDCQAFCKNAMPEPKCIQGQAYKDQFGNFVSCQNGQGCPANFDCYFDGTQWGCCPTKAYTCSLNSDSGVQCGAGSTFKFFYNSHTQNCDSFQYNGCDGNSNNFASRESCEQFCSVGGCPNGGTPLRDHQGMMRVCGGGQAGDCPETHECTPVVAGQSTVNRCCPTRAYLCGLPPQQGSQCAAQPVTRYYFNIVTAQCTSFQFGGCDGNQNNFLTIQQCRTFCMSNACPAGNVAYVDPNSQQPIHCNEALSNSCPTGYECTFNPLINNHVCCGATDLGVCPDGEKAYMDTLSLSPRECVINMEASCPSNYLCRFHMQKNKYYCCASTKGKTCPVGKFLYRDPRSNQPARCTMGRSEQCPEGFSCQSYLQNALQGFCCTANSICPDDAEYVVDDQSQQPRACTMGTFVSCPAGFTCLSHNSATEGFCCRSSSSSSTSMAVVSDGCPPGNFVYLVNGEIGQCDPFNPPNAPCPQGFTCQWSTSNQRYQCCGSNPAPAPVKLADGCPVGQVAFRESGTVRVCTAGSSSCPTGYFCQFSTSNHQFQCCGVSGGCPSDSVAFVGVSGEAERCVIGQSNCPEGFACQRSISGNNVCCTVKPIRCSSDEVTVEGVCHPRVAPGQSCIASQQCTGGAVCTQGVCSCPSNTAPIGNFCRPQLKCAPGQISHNDLCHNPARVGEGCVIGKQCPEGSGCMDGICECKRGLVEKGDKCIPPPVVRPSPPAKKTVSAACSKKGFSPLRDPETGRVVMCNPGSRACPAGHQCQINWKKTQYICCTNTNAPQVETTADDVCPSGRTPYLLNGAPQKCTKQRCPNGFDCIYRKQEYFCCASARPSLSQPPECRSGGSALLHPATRTAVLCTPLHGRQCPSGYSCQLSGQAAVHICCPVLRDQHGSSRGGPCPDFLVLVSRIVGGRIDKRCERACPYPEVPVGGVCYELRQRQ